MTPSVFDGDYDYGYPDETRGASPKFEKAQAALVATPCSEIEEKKVSWLWKGYVPRSSLTLIEGPPKAGKSTALADIAARVSVGADMPDHQPCECPGAVLLISDEDAPAEVIVPRLRVAGAMLESVRIVKAVDSELRPRRFVIGPEDIERLEILVKESGAVLVIVDPLSIYMGAADAHREQDVRQTLWHLSELAERTGVSIVACRHWKKSRTGDALQQGGGSVGFSAAARSLLSVDRDPDDKGARVLACGYSNYATTPPSLAFRLEPVYQEDVARVAWGGVSRHDADSLASVRMGTEEHLALDEASEFLSDFLGNGGKPAKDVFAGSEAAGIARDTLRRAKASIGVTAVKSGMNGGWCWTLSPERAGGTVSSEKTAPVSKKRPIRIFEGTDGNFEPGDPWKGEPEGGDR